MIIAIYIYIFIYLYIHTSFMLLFRDKPLQTEVEEQASVLSYRKNVYDDDEFDIFHRDDIDTSRIHKGKK